MKRHFHPIYIPFERYQWPGGPATFMQNLQRYLDRQNEGYLSSLQHAKVVFSPTEFPLKKLKKVKRQGGYIIQRLVRSDNKRIVTGRKHPQPLLRYHIVWCVSE